MCILPLVPQYISPSFTKRTNLNNTSMCTYIQRNLLPIRWNGYISWYGFLNLRTFFPHVHCLSFRGVCHTAASDLFPFLFTFYEVMFNTCITYCITRPSSLNDPLLFCLPSSHLNPSVKMLVLIGTYSLAWWKHRKTKAVSLLKKRNIV